MYLFSNQDMTVSRQVTGIFLKVKWGIKLSLLTVYLSNYSKINSIYKLKEAVFAERKDNIEMPAPFHR